MAMKGVRGYLICYDIANERRLAHLHHFISRHAVMVQYSVYYLETTEANLADIVDGIRQRIAAHADDVRIYPLPSSVQVKFLGNAEPMIGLFSSHIDGMIATAWEGDE